MQNKPSSLRRLAYSWRGFALGILGACALFSADKKPEDPTPFAAALAMPQARLREAVLAYLYPQAMTAPQPSFVVVSTTKEDGYERQRVRYAVDADEFVEAWLLIPNDRSRSSADGKLPTILALHPTGAEGKDRVINLWDTPAKDQEQRTYRESRAYGEALVKRGFLVLAPDRLAFGERKPLPADKKYWEQMPEANKRLKARYPAWGLMGKNVWDLQRAIDVLEIMPQADITRLGVIGHSLGAWDACMLMPVDTRVKAAVISHTGPLRWRPNVWSQTEALEKMTSPETLKKLGAEVNQNIFYMLMAPRPVFVIWSIADAYDQPPGLIEGARVISAYNRTLAQKEGVPFDFNFYLHASGHNFPPEVRAAAFIWLEDRLR